MNQEEVTCKPKCSCTNPKYTKDSLFNIWTTEEGKHMCSYNVQFVEPP